MCFISNFNRTAFIRVAFLFVLAALPAAVSAGRLDDFEKEATENGEAAPAEESGGKDKSRAVRPLRHDDPPAVDKDGDCLSCEIFRLLLVFPGQATLARVNSSYDSGFGVEPRKTGEPDIPFIRADLNYQRISRHISAIGWLLQAGYGPAAAQYRQTHYTESSPSDSLDLIQVHGLYRMSPVKKIEFGPGLGAMLLEGGGQSGGFSVTFPLTVYPAEPLAFNLTPAWGWIHGNLVSEYDWSAGYVRKFFSYKLGYKSLRVRREKLAGPYIGVSYHY